MADETESQEQLEIISDSAEFAEMSEALQSRCKLANIKFSKEKDPEGGDYCVLELPNGREKRGFTLFNTTGLNKLLKIPFEKFTFLGDYEAVCCYEDSVIEAPIRTVGLRGLNDLKRLFQKQDETAAETAEDASPLFSLSNPGEVGDKKVVVGPASEEAKILFKRGFGFLARQPISLRLEGFKIATHDEALDVLERVSGSLFLQIDLIYDFPLALIKTRRYARRVRRNIRLDKALEFPKSSYDNAPMSLYFYARAATSMPLLQFLAYYQTIEFYFPTFSQADALRRIQNLLKDPTFRSDRETDLTRLLTATRTGGQSGYGDERSQLRATVQECVDANELRHFLETDSQVKDFFSSKAKGLTDHKLPIANPDADLRNDVADRIYDIRCKVVHTKSGAKEGELELLLPFSKEAGMLQYDIDLLQFIARKVLIAASSTIAH
jgi:hypothetical protein